MRSAWLGAAMHGNRDMLLPCYGFVAGRRLLDPSFSALSILANMDTPTWILKARSMSMLTPMWPDAIVHESIVQQPYFHSAS